MFIHIQLLGHKMKKKKGKSKSKDGRDIVKQVPHRSVGGVNLPHYEIPQEWESYLERSAIYTLAMCHDVTNIQAQQKTFEYIDKQGVNRKYTPDLIFTANGENIICEIKPLIFLLTENNREKYTILHSAFIKEGYQFHFLTDDQLLNEPRNKNIKFIIRYKSHHLTNKVLENFRYLLGNAKMSIKDLLPENNTQNDLANIYAAIMQGHLCVDFDVEINLNSIIYFPSLEHERFTYVHVRNSGRYGSILQKLVLDSGPTIERILAIEKSKKQQLNISNPLGFF